VLADVNELSKQVQKTREAVEDAQTVATVADVAASRAALLASGQRMVQPADLAARLHSYQQPADAAEDAAIRWELVSQAALRYFAAACVPAFVLGSLGQPPPPATTRRVAERQKRAPDAPLQRPDELQGADLQTDHNARVTTSRIEDMHKRLQRERSINLFNLIVNPHSFSQSVENLFYFSFLIKDGHAALNIDKAGEPIASASAPPSANNVPKRQQAIMTFDNKLWQAAKRKYNIRESFMPHRQQQEDAVGAVLVPAAPAPPPSQAAVPAPLVQADQPTDEQPQPQRRRRKAPVPAAAADVQEESEVPSSVARRRVSRPPAEAVATDDSQSLETTGKDE